MQIKRNDTYEDIMHLPRHVSAKRKQMSLRDRAAQFAPFAALTGHDAAVQETARLTEKRIQLDENEIALLDQKLQYIAHQLEAEDEQGIRDDVTITYFLPDQRKDGGKYVEISGKIKKIDAFHHRLVMEDGTMIPIPDIFRINLENYP